MKHNHTLFLYGLAYLNSEWNYIENLTCHVGSVTHTQDIVLATGSAFGNTLFPTYKVTLAVLFISLNHYLFYIRGVIAIWKKFISTSESKETRDFLVIRLSGDEQ